MPLDVPGFNDAFYRARDKVATEEGTDVAAIQEELLFADTGGRIRRRAILDQGSHRQSR